MAQYDFKGEINMNIRKGLLILKGTGIILLFGISIIYAICFFVPDIIDTVNKFILCIRG